MSKRDGSFWTFDNKSRKFLLFIVFTRKILYNIYMKKSIWTKQMDLQSKKIKKFLDDDERAKLPTIWHSKFEKFWMTMNERSGLRFGRQNLKNFG